MLAKKFAVGFGLAVVFPLMVHYGVSTFSPPPKYDDYRIEYPAQFETATPEEKKELAQEKERSWKERQEHEKRHQRHLFYVLAPAGLIAIIVGAFVGVQAIGSGLMFGGVFAMVDGYFWYWSKLDSAMKFASLAAAFVVLLVIGFRKLGAPAAKRN